MDELSDINTPIASVVAEPTADLAASVENPAQASLAVRATVLTVIIAPLLGLVAAPFAVWGWGFRWTDLSLLLSLYVLTVLGITVGYHRLFVHRSFETNIVVKFALAVLGSMAVQGSLLRWVAMHRMHHQHADTPDDPHSPHGHDGGVFGVLRGFWHAHIGWFFGPEFPGMERYVQDLSRSRALRIASDLFPVWVAFSFLIPAVLGGVLTGRWSGFWTGLIWGGLVRVFLVHHVTWSVNSACHLWGMRPFQSNDESRNNILFGFLAMGEGWHNTHHAFPTSARHGLRWWQVDMSYWAIWTLARLGLAWNVKVPSLQAQRQRQRAV